MAFAVARQERYRRTKKGQLAYLRSCEKEMKKLRSTEEGRMVLRLRKIKCRWGQAVADWYEKQKPMCKICGKNVNKSPENSKDKQDQAVIDHDHCYTAKDYRNNPKLKPRGLLCHQCNVGIGNFKDSIDRLLNAILYLSRNST
tara:strand:- start:3357 stop:3785 length:429 start_codon:yes stop_codon:yes gene_type:complete